VFVPRVAVREREYSDKRLKLAQLLGQLGAFLTCELTKPMSTELTTARAGSRRFWLLSALRTHAKAPYKMDFHRKKLRNAKGA
jgi:hypothetical protein